MKFSIALKCILFELLGISGDKVSLLDVLSGETINSNELSIFGSSYIIFYYFFLSLDFPFFFIHGVLCYFAIMANFDLKFAKYC